MCEYCEQKKPIKFDGCATTAHIEDGHLVIIADGNCGCKSEQPLVSCPFCQRNLVESPLIEIKFGDVMPLEEFIECCNQGGFIDDDGVGYYTNDEKRYNYDHPVSPSDICNGTINRNYKFVVWFNR